MSTNKGKSTMKQPIWHTSAGESTRVIDMQTSHLFFTLRLVWNSYMPRPLNVGTGKGAYFTPSFYDAEYMQDIIPAMYKELLERDDISNHHKDQLEDMQLPHLLARVCDDNAVYQAMVEYKERDDKDFEPDSRDSSAANWTHQRGPQL